MKLHYSLLGEYPNIFIVHGILGSGQNWRTFARKLHKRVPNLGIALIDLRNHGRSPRGDPPHTLRACAEDLLRLSSEIGSPDIVVGHSFGGKVALEFSILEQPLQTWILDSPPGAISEKPEDQSEVLQVIQALRSVPVPLAKRKDLIDILMVQGFSRPVAQWLTTNLTTGKDGYVWRFDIGIVEELIQDYFQRDLWPMLENPMSSLDIHIVRAQNSDRWTPTSIRRLNALESCSAHRLPNAGHWVHVDNPQALCNLLVRHFPS